MKAVTLLLKYDYGKASRGESGEKSIILPALKSAILNVEPFWLEENGYPNDMDGLQNNIIKFVNDNDPDIVFMMLLRQEIKTTTIDKLHEKHIVINWFCDDQWRFDSFTKYIAPHLSWSITTDKYSIPKYYTIGCDKVIHSQWASINYENQEVSNKKYYEFEISFVGGANSTREWIINSLAKRGIKVECFGSNWPNGRVSNSRMVEIFKNSKINLNLSNNIPVNFSYSRFLIINILSSLIGINSKHYGGYLRSIRKSIGYIINSIINKKKVEALKARVFEIAGAGGFQISQFCLEVENYFIPGKEIVLFSSLEELIRLINYYKNNEKEREEIAEQARLKAIGQTYENRIKEIIKIIENEDPIACGL